jgi:S-phase kinase-associated protein 1
MAEVVEAWDAAYIDVDQELMFEIILAANYLDVKPLLDLACAKVSKKRAVLNTKKSVKTTHIVLAMS